VYDNAKGVSCYRITFTSQTGTRESIDFALGTTVKNTIGADAFSRLEFDMEVKQDAVFRLEIFRDNEPVTYWLHSGSNLWTGPGATSGESDSSHPRFNCGARSDSGPDSGPNDNCRWVINEVGDSFKLTPTHGEGSLEGGGDFSDFYANNTKIFLISLRDTGYLTCTPAPGEPVPNDNNRLWDNQTAEVGGGPITSCQTTRIDPSNLPSVMGGSQSADCDVAFGYDLQTFLSGNSRCQLEKTFPLESKQLAGSIQITFEPEDSEPLGGEPLTNIAFVGGNPAGFSAPRCEGTVVNDANGNPTILEILSGNPSQLLSYEDQVADTSVVDWACVLDTREVYLGGGQMQIIQTILYWGDIKFERF
jgi:hypothetical protein